MLNVLWETFADNIHRTSEHNITTITNQYRFSRFNFFLVLFSKVRSCLKYHFSSTVNRPILNLFRRFTEPSGKTLLLCKSIWQIKYCQVERCRPWQYRPKTHVPTISSTAAIRLDYWFLVSWPYRKTTSTTRDNDKFREVTFRCFQLFGLSPGSILYIFKIPCWLKKSLEFYLSTSDRCDSKIQSGRIAIRVKTRIRRRKTIKLSLICTLLLFTFIR